VCICVFVFYFYLFMYLFLCVYVFVCFCVRDRIDMPGVGLMVKVADLGSPGPEFKSCSVVELLPGGIDSACHPSELGKMSTSLLG